MMARKINPILKRIQSNWKLDAKMEDDKYFYSISEVNSLLNDEKCYVIGRKGSGKTAICQHIIKSIGYNKFATRLSFKNFPFNELYNLENHQYTTPNQYITLWKYLIYSNVCKMMVDNESINEEIRIQLEHLYPKNDVKQLNRKVSEWTSIGFGATIFGSGGKLNFSREVGQEVKSWIDRVNILEDIIMNYCDSSKYYIVFDELDEDYRDIKNLEESSRYKNLLTSLFKAVQDVKATFLDTNKKIMPIVFLRDDIYMLLSDADKNKWRDLMIELEWDKEKLKKMLAYRISKDIDNSKSNIPFNAAWEKIFSPEDVSYGTNKSKKMNNFNYISRSTQLRPRDFIQYIKGCCSEAIEKGDFYIRERTISYEERAFSNYLKDEIKDEVFPLLPEIDNIFQVISNLRKWNFSLKEFIDEYNRYLEAGTIIEKNIDYVIDVLFNFSVVGNQNKYRKDVLYFKYMFSNMTYNKEENIVIHRGLFKALQIQ